MTDKYETKSAQYDAMMTLGLKLKDAALHCGRPLTAEEMQSVIDRYSDDLDCALTELEAEQREEDAEDYAADDSVNETLIRQGY